MGFSSLLLPMVHGRRRDPRAGRLKNPFFLVSLLPPSLHIPPFSVILLQKFTSFISTLQLGSLLTQHTSSSRHFSFREASSPGSHGALATVGATGCLSFLAGSVWKAGHLLYCFCHCGAGRLYIRLNKCLLREEAGGEEDVCGSLPET